MYLSMNSTPSFSRAHLLSVRVGRREEGGGRGGGGNG